MLQNMCRGILEVYFKFRIQRGSLITMGQNVFKSILEVYVIFRIQKYILSIAQYQQDKVPIKVHVPCRAMASWLPAAFSNQRSQDQNHQEA